MTLLPLQEKTRYFSLGFELIKNEYIRYQVIELDHKMKLLANMPIFLSYPGVCPNLAHAANDPDLRNTFTIRARSQDDVRLASLTLGLLVNRPSRHKRSTFGLMTCYAVPVLAIYNYVTSGTCNQPDRFFKYVRGMIVPPSAIMLHVAGDGEAKPGVAGIPAPAAGPALVQTQVRVAPGGRDLFRLHGVAKACRIPLDDALRQPVRQKRGTEKPEPVGGASCFADMTGILDAFVGVFGDSHDAALFDRVIQQILDTGSTGYAVHDPGAEQRLVDRVRSRLRSPGEISTARRAYASAASLYYMSAFGVMNPERADAKAVASIPADSPAGLGEYRLNLSRYVSGPLTPPLQRRGQGWSAVGICVVDDVRTGSRNRIRPAACAVAAAVRWPLLCSTAGRTA